MSNFFYPLIVFTIFFGPPLIAIVCFAVYLTKYLLAKRKNKADPGSVSEERVRTLRHNLIVSCVVAVVFVAAVVSFIVRLMSETTFM